MKSKGLFGKKYLDIQERVRELPALAEDFVLVKVRACGVCGTDINFVRDWDDEPMALGHEISAEVVEVGRNVNTVQPGDSVIVEDCTMCGVCPRSQVTDRPAEVVANVLQGPEGLRITTW